MRLIPVIDLMGGVVVRGEGGRRESYRPIATKLAEGSAPVDVARGLLEAIDARGYGEPGSGGILEPVIYVADLDAIMGGTAQVGVLRELSREFPTVTWWVDAGFRTSVEAETLQRNILEGHAVDAAERIVPVLGSETLRDVEALRTRERPYVLSLDFGVEGYRGPDALLERPDLWPDDVIVMSLTKVGSTGGPDLERLGGFKGAAGERRIYAAGGVRGPGDLTDLSHAGAEGVLLASALHTRELP